MKEKKSSYLSGAAILAAGGIFAKLLGIFFKTPLSQIIGDYGLGLYGYAYPIYNAFLAISIAGLPVAVSKMIAERVSVGNYKGAYKVFRVAFFTLAALGLAGSLVMFFGANAIIAACGWPSDAYYSVIALSFAPFFVAMVSACRGFFQGMQHMGYSSVSQIVDQVGRVGIGLAAAILLTRAFSSNTAGAAAIGLSQLLGKPIEASSNFGVSMGASGATFGATAGAICSFLFLTISYRVFKTKQKQKLALQAVPNRESTAFIFRTLILLALPIAFSGLVNTIMELINSATIATCLQRAGIALEEATILFGQLEQKAQTLVNVPLVLGSALSASLVPTISASYAKKERRKAVKKTSLAIRVAFLISLPCAVGLCVLAEPLIKLFFFKSDGYEMLMGLSFVAVFTIGMSSMQAILQGAGHFYKPLKNLIVGALIKYLMNLLLISNPLFGVYGAVISSVFASAVIFVLNFYDVKRYIGMDPIGFSVIKTIFSAVVMGVFAHFCYGMLASFISYRIAVLATVALSAVVYFALVFFTRAFTRKDLEEVRG